MVILLAFAWNVGLLVSVLYLSRVVSNPAMVRLFVLLVIVPVAYGVALYFTNIRFPSWKMLVELKTVEAVKTAPPILPTSADPAPPAVVRLVAPETVQVVDVQAVIS